MGKQDLVRRLLVAVVVVVATYLDTTTSALNQSELHLLFPAVLLIAWFGDFGDADICARINLLWVLLLLLLPLIVLFHIYLALLDPLRLYILLESSNLMMNTISQYFP